MATSNATLLGLSVDACSGERWTKAVFLRPSDTSPSFFNNISSWDGADYKQWLVQDLKVSYIPSAVFLGMALCTGLIFVAWRLVFCCCCMGCYVLPCGCSKQRREQRAYEQQRRQQEANGGAAMGEGAGGDGALPPGALYMVPGPQDIQRQYYDDEQATCPWDHASGVEAGKAGAPYAEGGHHGQQPCCADPTAVKAIKFVITFLALGAAGITIWGMVETPKAVASDGWDAVANITLYVRQLNGGLQGLINNASMIVPAVTLVQNVANTTLRLDNLTQKAETLGTWLNDPDLPPNRVTNSTQGAIWDLANYTLSSATLQAGLPTLQQQLGRLQASSARVGGSGAQQQVAGAQSTLSALDQRLRGMPASESRDAVLALQQAISQLNLTQRQSDMTQLAGDLGTLQASVENTWRPFTTNSSAPVIGAVVTRAEGGPSVHQVTRAAIVANTSVVRGQASLANMTATFRDYWARHSTNSSFLANMVDYFEGIQINMVTLPPYATAAYDRLAGMQAYVSAITPLQSVETETSLARLQDVLRASSPTLNTLAATLTPLNASLNAMPPAAAIGTLTASAASTSAALRALSPPLLSTSSAVSAYLASPSPSTYDALLGTLPASYNGTGQSLAALAPLVNATSPGSSAPGAPVFNASTALNATLAATDVTQQLVDASTKALDDVTQSVADVKPSNLFLRLNTAGALVTDAFNDWPPPRSKVLSALVELIQLVNSVVNEQGTQAISSLNSTLTQSNSTLNDVQTAVLDQLNNMRSDLYEPTTTIDKAWYIGGMVIYSVCLLELLLLLVSMYLRWPAMFTFSLFLLAILVIFYFIIAFAMAWALAGGNDACPGAEQIAVSFVGAKSQPAAALAQYYFFQAGGNLSNVLYQNGFINMQGIDAAVEQLTNNLMNNLTSRGFLPVGQFNASLALTNFSIFATLGASNYLVNWLSYPTFNPVYVTTKAFFCCDLPTSVYNVWVAYTFGGWAIMVLSWLAYWLVSVHDRTPGAHQRCGCVCLSPPPCCARGGKCCGASVGATSGAPPPPPKAGAVALGFMPAAGIAAGATDGHSHGGSSPAESDAAAGGGRGAGHGATAILNPLGGASASGTPTPDKLDSGLVAGNYQPASARYPQQQNTGSYAYGSAMGPM